MSPSVANLMGKVVLVDKVFVRDYVRLDTGRRDMKAWRVVESEGRPGWVVGERHLQDGFVIWNGWDEPVEWEQNGETHHCLLVAFWPSVNPVRVPLDGYRMAPSTVRPYRADGLPWTKNQRQWQRAVMKGWPRDEKGRWVKKCPIGFQS